MTIKITSPMRNDQQFFNFHLSILKRLIAGETFAEISTELQNEMEELNYIDIAKRGLLAFDNEENLIGAYPVSPYKTNYKVIVDGIGTGYSMCAIDALGVAYTFEAKTTIETIDSSSGNPITIKIDPSKKVQDYQDFVISYKKNVDPNVPTAFSLCPTIDFYSDKNSIDEREGSSIINFEDALKSAKMQFSQQSLQVCASQAISRSLGEGDNSSCCSSSSSEC